MTFRIFREPGKGVVVHTAASKVLAETPLLRQWIGQSCEGMWPAATGVVEAMARWPGSEEPNQAGVNMANDTEETIYQVVGNDAERAKRFADAMSFFHQWPGLDMKYLLEGYDWAPKPNLITHEAAGQEARNETAAGESDDPKPSTTVFVDIGGSHGPVSIALAQKFPFFRCIV